jgi:hypothetical protein
VNQFRLRDSVGGTPTGATGTVALPKNLQGLGQKSSVFFLHFPRFYRRDQDPGKLALTNVNQAVHDVVELTRPRWRDQAQRDGRSIHVECQLESTPALLLCNASEFREALTNIIFNSVDALLHRLAANSA